MGLFVMGKCLDSSGFWVNNSLTDAFSLSFSFSFSLNFYCYSITVVCLFSPSLHPTPAEPTPLPHLHPPPWFCACVLYSSSCNPLSPLSPPHSPLAIVRLFLTSMSLVIFCLLFSSTAYVPVKGEIICFLNYFNSHAKLLQLQKELIDIACNFIINFVDFLLFLEMDLNQMLIS